MQIPTVYNHRRSDGIYHFDARGIDVSSLEQGDQGGMIDFIRR